MQQNQHRHESTPDRVLNAAVSALRKMDSGNPVSELSQQGQDGTIIAHLLFAFFRHRAVIDWILAQFCDVKRTRDQVLNVLRVGCCQLVYQKGVHDHIVTDTCVRFVRSHCTTREAGFVNAILRRLIREGPDAWSARAHREGPPYVQHELSPELYAQWQRHFDPEQLAMLAHVSLQPAELTVRRRRPETAAPPGCVVMAAPAWAAEADLWCCHDPRALFSSEIFQDAAFYVQDPATLMAPAFLLPKPGERIADLCCAPGGKTLFLADHAPPESRIFSFDRSTLRISRLRTAADATAESISIGVGDATAPPFRNAVFDGVLLDVPCSNTGVIRRRPDVRWTFSKQTLQRLQKLQRTMLQACSRLIKPGGRMVYSTCSIEPEENEEQIQWFLQMQSNFTLQTQEQLLPAASHDGAYAALLVKTGN